ncbi:MAG: SPASM domain-containing protein [Candidatus Omnitrophica bacterium]|nr:SPASM domain-containing protein [Candidatus Omnitrophota bacterium]
MSESRCAGGVDLGSDPTEGMRAADDAVRSGDLQAARESYRALLARDLGNLDARVALDYVEYRLGGKHSRYQGLELNPSTETLEAKQRNLAVWEEEAAKGRVRLQSRPIHIFLEHTTRCNFYCLHCSKGYDEYEALDMDQGALEKVFEPLLPTTLGACITGFGEPTISKEYLYILRRLAENGVSPHFSTNTSTLTIPHLDLLLRIHADVILSLDGATRETFETIRTGGKWEHLLYSLHAIRWMRSILPSRARFSVTFVAMKMNVHELPEMVRLVHRYGLDSLKVHDFNPIGSAHEQAHRVDAGQSLWDDAKRANAIFDEAEKAARELGVEIHIPPRYVENSPGRTDSRWRKLLATRGFFPARRRFPQPCLLPWRAAQVRVNGVVSPCCVSTREMGNLSKKPFLEIWNDRPFRAFRRRMKTFFPPPECRKCHVFEGINNGNPANTMAKEGLLLKVLYFIEDLFARAWARYKDSRREPGEAPAPRYFKGKYLRTSSTD